MSKSSYLKGENTLLYYQFRAPKIKNENPPLLILLHGVGSSEHHFYSLIDQFPDEYLVVVARAPFENKPGSYRWFAVDFSSGMPQINEQEAEKSRIILVQFINQLKEIHQFDYNRIILGGFSQGAIMSYSLGLTHPIKVKGIIGLSGRILKEIRPLVKTSDTLENLQVLTIHGVNDQVLPIHFAREAKIYLEELKVKLTYIETQNDHSVSIETLNLMNDWLNKING